MKKYSFVILPVLIGILLSPSLLSINLHSITSSAIPIVSASNHAEFLGGQGVSGVGFVEPRNLSIGNTIHRITNWLLGLLLALSTFFVVYAAFLFLLAGPNPDNAAKAVSFIKYAAIAIALGVGAKVVISVTLGLLGLSSASSGNIILDIFLDIFS